MSERGEEVIFERMYEANGIETTEYHHPNTKASVFAFPGRVLKTNL